MKYSVTLDTKLEKEEVKDLLSQSLGGAEVEEVMEMYAVDLIWNGDFYDAADVVASGEEEAREVALRIFEARAYQTPEGEVLSGVDLTIDDVRISQ